MASAKSLRKYAKDDLTPFMIEMGFDLIKGFSFIKNADESMIYFIDCHASRWGNVTFDVGIYVPELDEGQRKDLIWPKAMRSLVGGELQPDEPMKKYIQHSWNFENQPEVEIKLVKQAIEQFALPFFGKIRSRTQMLDAIDNDWYKWQKDEQLLAKIADIPNK